MVNPPFFSKGVPDSVRDEIKWLLHWVELFFGVKVIAVNSHRLPEKGRKIGPILGHTTHYGRMIITLQPGYSIPLIDSKKTKGEYLMIRRNIYTKHLSRAHARYW
ncbi:hypothetical protein ZWY2020_023794 [Hordeum vulgare]|nr:hypothetical protein ZWY2020_023794 [Hordeum vulgare]